MGEPKKQDEAAVKTRRGRGRIVVALIVGIPLLLIAILVLVIVGLPWIFTGEQLADQAVLALTQKLGVPVSVSRLEYHPLRGFELRGLRLGPPPGFERDVATIERVVLRYDLSGLLARRLTIEQLSIESPRLTLETRLTPGGELERNVDALSRRLAGAPKAPEEPQNAEEAEVPPSASDAGRPFSSIALILERLAIEGLGVELVGEGPNARLVGMSLGARGSIEANRIEGGARLGVTPETDAPNVLVAIPASRESPATSAALTFTLTATLGSAARAGDNVELEDVRLGISSALEGKVVQGELVLPPLDLRVGLGAVVEPRADRAVLSQLHLALSGDELLRGRAVLAGLSQLLEAQLGVAAGRGLAVAMGLEVRSKEARIAARVERLALPLETLAPYAKVFAPDLSIGGVIRLAPIEIEASLEELSSGAPRVLRADLALDRVSVFRVGAQRLGFGPATGSVVVARRREGAGFGISGTISVRDLIRAQTSARGVTLGIDGVLEHLVPPLEGETALAVDLGAKMLVVPGGNVSGASVEVRVAGRELLAADRDGSPPIAIDLIAGVEGARVDTGTVAHGLEILSLDLSTALDRLVAPARSPIRVVGKLGVAHAFSGARDARGGSIHLDGMLSDPRSDVPIDGELLASISADGVFARPLSLAGAKLEVKISARDVKPRAWPGVQPGLWPGAASLSLVLALPKVVVEHPLVGRVTTKLAGRLELEADLARQTAFLRAFELDANELVRLDAIGRAASLFQPAPSVAAEVKLAPVDLARLVSIVPPKLGGALEGLNARGAVGLEAAVKGRLPKTGERLDLADPPLTGELALELTDVALRLPSRHLELSGLNGRVSLDLSKGTSEVTSELALARLEYGQGRSLGVLEGLRQSLHAGRRGEVWSIASALEAKTMQEEGAQGLAPRLEVDAVYTRRGDLELRRFNLGVPMFGLQLDATGRLARKGFGVFRPSFTTKGTLDLDRLRTIVPQVGASHGLVKLELAAETRSETELEAFGALELEGVSHERPGLAVRRANGRVPFEQRLRLPLPIMREEVAASEGALGDDLEQRIAELEGDLRSAKLYLDADDILLEAPRAADYQPLRPFFGERGAKVTVEEVELKDTVLRALALEGLWRSGVLRFDRFAMRIWDGDILGDFALQLTADQNARARFRSTLTHLNLDIPYALANHLKPVSDPKEKEQYAISGTLDLAALVRERSVTMKLDLTKLDKPTLDRLFDGLIDPKRENPTINNARTALASAGFMGLRTSSGLVTIAQNRFAAHFDFERVWLDLDAGALWKAPLIPFRWVARLVFGPIIIANVNGAFPDNFSVGPWVEQAFAKLPLDALFRPLDGRVIADERQTTAGRGRAP